MLESSSVLLVSKSSCESSAPKSNILKAPQVFPFGILTWWIQSNWKALPLGHSESMGCLVGLVLNKMGDEVWPQLHVGSPVAANLIVVRGWKYGQHLTPPKKETFTISTYILYNIHVYLWKQQNQSYRLTDWKHHVLCGKGRVGWPGSLTGVSSRAVQFLTWIWPHTGLLWFHCVLLTDFHSPLQLMESKVPLSLNWSWIFQEQNCCSSLVTPFICHLHKQLR